MLMLYVLKSAILLAVFYAVFFFALQRETFHRFNRCVILAIVALSLVLPCLHVVAPFGVPLVGCVQRMVDGVVTLDGVEVSPGGGRSSMALGGRPFFMPLVRWAYLAGVAFMLLRLMVQTALLVRNLSSGARCSDGHGNTVVLKSGNVPPYSIFRYIVMSVADYERNRRSILAHEQEHIRLGHTYDKLLMEFAKVVQWFNPAVWLLARDLDTLHEYEADEAVLRKGIDAKTYQTLLVLKAVGNRLQPFANNLNRGSLKRRIIMMNQKKSSGWMMLKALFIVPAAAVAVSAFAVDNAPNQQARKVATAQKTVAHKATAKGATYDVVEVMPEYPGGQSELIKYLGTSVKYPAAAKAAKKQGRAVVGFVVGTDGNVCDVKVSKSAGDESLDAEAVRVVKAMPKWTPGKQDGKPVRVRYMVPLTFSLN